MRSVENLRGKRLLLLGSNVYKDLIKQIADYYGLVLIFARLYPGALDEIADEVYTIDTTDASLMIPFIQSHNIDGIYMGASELIISSSCGYIVEAGFPCVCTPRQWALLQNKKSFKVLCKSFGLPITPEFDINAPEGISYPVIVKPVDGSGSEGLFECDSWDGLKKAFLSAREISNSGSAIIEKKVVNNALYAYYTITDGVCTLDLTEDTYSVKKVGKSFTKSIYLAPSYSEKQFIDLFDKKIKSMLASIGLRNGDIWFEVFHDRSDYYFNECGFRPAGHRSMFPVAYFSCVNQIASTIYFSLTGKGIRLSEPRLLSDFPVKRRYCIYPLHGKKGTISKIIVDAILLKAKEVLIVSMQRAVGDCIIDENSFSGLIGFVHFVYDKKEECCRIIKKIHECIQVTDINGNSMIQTNLNIRNEPILF